MTRFNPFAKMRELGRMLGRQGSNRRLTNGEGENLLDYYQDVRKKLLALPGSKVQ